MKRFEDYEKAYELCYELIDQLTKLNKESDGYFTFDIKTGYKNLYPRLRVEYCGTYYYSFFPQEDGTFSIKENEDSYTKDEVEMKIRKNFYFD